MVSDQANIRSFVERLFISRIFIVGAAFLVRMVILYAAWHRGVDFAYGNETGHIAADIASGKGFSSPLQFVTTGATAWTSPLYPYLLSGVFKVWGIYSLKSHVIIQVLNCIFAALIILPIYGMARNTFGHGVAVLSSWGWVFLPRAIELPIEYIWDTVLSALFVSIIVWATLAMRNQRRLSTWGLYGGLWAVGALVNPSVLSLFPFLLAWLIWEASKQQISWPKLAAATLAVFVLGLLPWTLRNYLVFHKLIPVRSNFGLELWLGNNQDVSELWSFSVHPYNNRMEAELYARLGETVYMSNKQQEALSYMRSHVGVTLYRILQRIGTVWFAISDGPRNTRNTLMAGPFYLRLYALMNALMTFFAWLGLWILYRRRDPETLPYLFVFLIFPIVFYLTHSITRYKFPMDPILLIVATFGAVSSLRKFSCPKTICQ
jgi:hypothetical protein